MSLIMEQNINTKTPLKFKGWLDTNNSRQANNTNMIQSIINWDYAHKTQNDNYALLIGAST